MSPQTGQDGVNEDLCVFYGDLIMSPSLLQEILHFISNPLTNSAELAAIRKAVQERALELKRRGKRGRPRAWERIDWIQTAMTAAYAGLTRCSPVP